METESIGSQRWQRTNVTNLLKNAKSGTSYGRVKSNGKQKWRSLRTLSVSVEKLRLADFEKEIRAWGLVENGTTIGDETIVARVVAMFRALSLNKSAASIGVSEPPKTRLTNEPLTAAKHCSSVTRGS